MKFTYQIGIGALFGSFAVTAPANTLSLSLSIKEGDVAAGHHSKDVVTKELTDIAETHDICRLICFSEATNCPEDWYSKQMGENCWTCCRSTSEEVSSKSPALALQHNKAVVNKHVGKDSVKDVITKELAHLTEDNGICWRACFPESQDCPEGWHSTQLGSCWTCCRSTSEEVSSKSPTLALQDNQAIVNKYVGKDSVKDVVTKELTHIAEGNDICWLACFSQSRDCPEGWYSKQLGDCWTCCRSTSGAKAKHAAKLEISASHKGEKPGL